MKAVHSEEELPIRLSPFTYLSLVIGPLEEDKLRPREARPSTSTNTCFGHGQQQQMHF